MKKILLGLFFTMFAFQVNAATLSWDSINVATSGVVQSVDVDAQHLTGQVSFNAVSAVATTDTWTYNLNGDEIVDNVALEFFDNQMTVEKVWIDGTELTSVLQGSGDYATRLWSWSGLLTSGLHTLTLENVMVTAASGQYQLKVSTVPVPAAVWLFGSALMGLVGVSRRKSTAVAA